MASAPKATEAEFTIPENGMSKERVDVLIACARFHNTLKRAGLYPRGSCADVSFEKELKHALHEMELAEAVYRKSTEPQS